MEIIIMLGVLTGLGIWGMYKEMKPEPKKIIAKRKKKGGKRRVRVYHYQPSKA